MLNIVSWNICRRRAAWDALLRMRDEDGVDLALLQEVGKHVPEGVERGGEDWGLVSMRPLASGRSIV